MAARGPDGRFLPSGGGASTAADDVAGLAESLGVAGTAASDLNDQMSSLGGGQTSAFVSSLAAKFEGLGSAVSGGLKSALDGAGKGLAMLGENGIISAKAVETGNDALAKMGELLGPIAQVADTVAVVVGAVAEKLWEFGKAAVAATQAKDALRDTFDAFTNGGGQAMLDGLEDMAAKLPYTADKLNEWAEGLLAAGIAGDALQSSLQAVAASAALRPKDGGASAKALIERLAQAAQMGQKITLDRRITTQLRAAGVVTADLAKALGVPADKLAGMTIAADKLGDAMKTALITKGQKALNTMGQTWTSISAKLSEGWDDAFEDLGDIVGPFMAQLRSLASEFFAGSAAGGTFKDTIKAVLTPAFEIATRSIRALHIAYLNVLIAFLTAKIYLAPLTDGLGKLGVSTGIVNVAMYLLAGTVVIVAVVLGVLALAVFLVVLPFILVGVAIYAVVAALQYLYGIVTGAADNFDNLSNAASEGSSGVLSAIGGMIMGAIGFLAALPLAAAQAAGDFVGGLVSGISSGAGAVAAAVKSLAAGALSSFTSFFGIASPSKVMKKHGKTNIAEEGLAAGIDEGADAVDQAMNDMAAPPKGKGAGGKGGTTKIIRIDAINFYGPASDFPSFREQANAWLEEIGASGPEPEPS